MSKAHYLRQWKSARKKPYKNFHLSYQLKKYKFRDKGPLGNRFRRIDP